MADNAESIRQAIAQWLENSTTDKTINSNKLSLINRCLGSGEEGEAIPSSEHPAVNECDIGLLLNTGKRQDLRAPLKFLHALAKEQRQEFVIGKYDAQTGKPEKICYFGHEEGEADLFEVASYLGLKR